MKTSLRILAGFAACALLVVAGYYAAKTAHRYHAVVHASGASTPVRIDYRNSAGVESFLAVRSDGAWVSGDSVLRPDGTVYTLRSVTLPREGKAVFVMPDVAATQTAKLKHYGFYGPSHDDPNSQCVAPYFGKYYGDRAVVGEDAILGVRTFHIRHQLKDGAALDEWLAPDLGCLALRTQMIAKDKPAMINEAVAVARGEPEADLFRVNPRFKEMSPVEVDLAYEAKFHVSRPNEECVRRTEARRELIYQKRKD